MWMSVMKRTEGELKETLGTMEVLPNQVGLRRGEILRKLDEGIDAMHDLVTGRMVEIEQRVSAAVALSDLARTWEGIIRGVEKEMRMESERARRVAISNLVEVKASLERVFEKNPPVDEERKRR